MSNEANTDSYCWMVRSSEEPKNPITADGLRGGEGVRETMGPQQPLSVPLRSNQAKALCPHSKGPAAHWLNVIFFDVPLPQVF